MARKKSQEKPMFVLTWSSGHEPPLPVYHRETEDGYNAATYDRDNAKLFWSKQDALQRWLDMHRDPEQFEHCISDGSVRAEHLEHPEFCF
jgi:hypothetical protein